MSVIYIAGKWKERHRLKKIADKVESLGHIVVSRWLKNPSNAAKDFEKEARRDVEDLLACTLFILDSFEPGSGSEVELGFVCGLKERTNDELPHIWLVGPKRNIFHHYFPEVYFDNWCQVLKVLEVYSE
jgi:hypothetical protein